MSSKVAWVKAQITLGGGPMVALAFGSPEDAPVQIEYYVVHLERERDGDLAPREAIERGIRDRVMDNIGIPDPIKHMIAEQGIIQITFDWEVLPPLEVIVANQKQLEGDIEDAKKVIHRMEENLAFIRASLTQVPRVIESPDQERPDGSVH